MATAGWNSSARVRSKLQAALFWARRHRLERIEAAQPEEPPEEPPAEQAALPPTGTES